MGTFCKLNRSCKGPAPSLRRVLDHVNDWQGLPRNSCTERKHLSCRELSFLRCRNDRHLNGAGFSVMMHITAIAIAQTVCNCSQLSALSSQLSSCACDHTAFSTLQCHSWVLPAGAQHSRTTACALTSDHGYLKKLLIYAFFQALQLYSWGLDLIKNISKQCPIVPRHVGRNPLQSSFA